MNFLSVDISNFMSWFVSQVVSIFTQLFSILDSITFANTSLLKVMVTLVIIVPLVGIIITIAPNPIGAYGKGVKEGRSERKKEK